jgi:hypothetical protein
MTENDPHDAASLRSRRAALIGLIFVLVLVVGGLLLTHILRGMSEIQDCAMSGRTNCAPIDSTSTRNP